jgi:hypothetical protein
MVMWWEEDLNSMDDSFLHVEYRWGRVTPPNRSGRLVERPLAAQFLFRFAISDDDAWAWRSPEGEILSAEGFADRILGWLCARVRSGPPPSVKQRRQLGSGWIEDPS